MGKPSNGVYRGQWQSSHFSEQRKCPNCTERKILSNFFLIFRFDCPLLPRLAIVASEKVVLTTGDPPVLRGAGYKEVIGCWLQAPNLIMLPATCVQSLAAEGKSFPVGNRLRQQPLSRGMERNSPLPAPFFVFRGEHGAIAVGAENIIVVSPRRYMTKVPSSNLMKRQTSQPAQFFVTKV